MGISKEDYTLVKKDDSRNRFNPIVAKRITFAHQITQSQVGLVVIAINLQSLNTPTEMSAQGFVQATQSEINGAMLGIAKKNLRLTSSLKGILIPNKHYIVVDNYTINLIGDLASAIEVDEIIFGEIDSQQGDLIPASVKSRVKTVSVPVGQRQVNLGLEYNVGSNSTERVGDIQVKVRNGSVLYRNSGNSSTVLDGDYYEMDSGNGSGTNIMLNSSPSFAPLDLVVDYGVNTITNNDSLGTLQSLMGSMIKIAKDLAIVVGGSQNDYLNSNPSDIERRTFGDYVLSLWSRFDTALSLSAFVDSKSKVKYQTKALTSTISTNTTDITSLRFSNLTIGKTYRIKGQCYAVVQAAGQTVVTVVSNSVVLGRWAVQNQNATVETHISGIITQPFVAQANSVIVQVTFSGTASLSGDGTVANTYLTLEEFSNYEATTQWT